MLALWMGQRKLVTSTGKSVVRVVDVHKPTAGKPGWWLVSTASGIPLKRVTTDELAARGANAILTRREVSQGWVIDSVQSEYPTEWGTRKHVVVTNATKTKLGTAERPGFGINVGTGGLF